MRVAGIVEEVAADPQYHRPVPRDQGLERPLATLVATCPEPLQQLAVGHPGAGPRAEEGRELPGQRVGR